jgi:hypothetical protein
MVKDSAAEAICLRIWDDRAKLADCPTEYLGFPHLRQALLKGLKAIHQCLQDGVMSMSLTFYNRYALGGV